MKCQVKEEENVLKDKRQKQVSTVKCQVKEDYNPVRFPCSKFNDVENFQHCWKFSISFKIFNVVENLVQKFNDVQFFWLNFERRWKFSTSLKILKEVENFNAFNFFNEILNDVKKCHNQPKSDLSGSLTIPALQIRTK